MNAGQIKEGRQEYHCALKHAESAEWGALFFSVSANKDVWASWLLIGEYLENKELIPMKARSECSLKLLKFENVFLCVCLPHFSQFIFPSYLTLKDECPV